MLKNWKAKELKKYSDKMIVSSSLWIRSISGKFLAAGIGGLSIYSLVLSKKNPSDKTTACPRLKNGN